MKMNRAPEWLSRLSVRLLILSRVMISGLGDRDPSWALLCAWSLLNILPLLLPHPNVPLSFSPSLPLSKIKDFLKNEKKKI